jgi:biopolymer transport protein ExbD
VHAAVDDDRAILSADPDVEYADVVRAMDAMRARGGDALFPDLLISAGVR